MKKMSKQEREHQQIEYAVNAVLTKAEKENCKIVGISSCLGLEREIEWFCQKCNNRSNEKKKAITIRGLESIISYAEALEEAKKCDAIILMEKYTMTNYAMIENAMEYFDRMDVKLLGVISIK